YVLSPLSSLNNRVLHSFPTRRSYDLHVATSAILATKSGKQTITLTELLNSNALFSKNGKQIIKDGPIYLFKESDIHFEFPIKGRSEEHTSELQSRFDIVCRLLLEKIK